MTAAAAFAARVAVDAAAATSAVEVDGGVLLSTPELPTIWDLNQVLVAPGGDAALVEWLLHQLPAETMRITLFNPADAVGAARGWNRSHCLLMAAGDAAAAWPARAAQVDPLELRPLQERVWREEGLDRTEHLTGMLDRFGAFPGFTTVAARVEGEIGAWAATANGCIDDVWVRPRYRGRGLGRAVTQAALAAGGWFLWTASSDPVPQRLYRSLGMREVGTVVQLTRDPG